MQLDFWITIILTTWHVHWCDLSRCRSHLRFFILHLATEPLKSWHNNHYNHNNHMLKSVRLRCQSWLWAGHRSCKYAFCQYENIHMMKIYRFVWRYDATRYCQLWECQIIQIWLKVGKKKMHIQKVTRRSRSKGIGQ